MIINLEKHLISIFVILVSYTAFAQSGAVDVTFNPEDNHPTFTPVLGNVKKSHLFPDGKYLIAGDFTEYMSQNESYFLKLNQNGSVDMAFNLGQSGPNGPVTGFTVLSNDNILLYGSFNSYNGVPVDSIACISANGTLLSNFSVSSFCPISQVKDAVEQSDGKIVIVGEFGAQYDMIRLFSDGNIDAGFNEPVFVASTGQGIQHIYRDSLDRLYLCGSFGTVNGEIRDHIARFLPDGELDLNYQLPSDYSTNTLDMSVSPDGSLVACGSYTTLSSENSILGFFRALPDGTIDSNFTTGTIWGKYTSITRESGGSYILSFDNNTCVRIYRISQNGIVDQSFSGPRCISNHPNDVLAQPDGKIMLCGSNLIRRLTASGAFDPSFQISYGLNGISNDIEIANDDKIIIAGDFIGYNGVSKNSIVRLMPDGTLDNSFDPGSGVINRQSTLPEEQIYDVEILPNGRIFAGGYFGWFDDQPYNSFVCLLPDGKIDTSFHTGSGFQTINATPGTINLIDYQSDGKIIIGGTFNKYNGNTVSNFIRLMPDGTMDTTFQHIVVPNYMKDIEITSDDKIYLVGSFGGVAVNGVANSCSGIIRLDSDGAIDTTFSTGTIESEFGINDFQHISIYDTNRILVCGRVTVYAGDTVNHTIRLFSNGSLDTTFNVSGFDETSGNFDNESDFQAKALTDGRILLLKGAAWQNTSAKLVRLKPDGSADSSFIWQNAPPISIFDLQHNGKIIVGGLFNSYNNLNRHKITRILNDTISNTCQFLNVHFTQFDTLTCNTAASIRAYASYGNVPYSYSWDNAGANIDDTIAYFSQSGIHYLSVIDSIGCTYEAGFLIHGPSTTSGADMRVSFVPGEFRPGFSSTSRISTWNDGCNATHGQVFLIKDTLVSFLQSDPMPDIISGDTLIWNFPSQGFEDPYWESEIEFMTSTSAAVGDSIHFHINTVPANPDQDTTNNELVESFEVLNGYDPNDKHVFPTGQCAYGYIKPNQKLTYMLRFQNTGNSEAINIRIEDSLSSYLDINSLRILHSSHNYYTLVDNETVNFMFDEIHLPDSSSAPEESKGFIVYEVSPKQNLFENSTIKNKASIFFDFNTPIVTNETINTVSEDYLLGTRDTVSMTVCDFFEYNGQELLETGIYQFSDPNIDGCNNLTIVDLVVHRSQDSVIDLYGIDSVSYNGTVYYQSGEYQQSFNTIYNCDSIVHLNVNLGFSGFSSQVDKNEILISPNPAHDQLRVSNCQLNDVSSIQIVDASGKTFRTVVNPPSENVNIPVGDLSNGIYFVKVETTAKSYFLRFVKN